MSHKSDSRNTSIFHNTYRHNNVTSIQGPSQFMEKCGYNNDGSFIHSVLHNLMVDCINSGSCVCHRGYIKAFSGDRHIVTKFIADTFENIVEDYDGCIGFAPTNDKWPKCCAIQLQGDVEESILYAYIYGTEEFIEFAKNDISGKISLIGPTISWVFDKRMSTVCIPLDTSRLPIDEMYPFVSQGLDEYYEKFYKSSSNVLICMGEPGTGKTTFLRGMLNHLNVSATVSYDQALFEEDRFFANFLTSDNNIMIIEDADVLLTPRSDGNSAMQRFLNSGDGLVSSPRRKLIFTTNLPNIKHIDPALVRSGRCFDVLHFRKLDNKEIANISSALGVNSVLQDDVSHTLAETMTTIGNPHDKP